jgi:O-methyltransferase
MVWALCQRLLAPLKLEIVRSKEFDLCAREEGLDWPGEAETMVGLKRLDNLESCITDVLRRGVPGDLIETGVWRGGASIFMRAVLKVSGDTQRTVWLADSFQGLPKPDPRNFPADAGDKSWKYATLAVPLEEVQMNFRRYGLLDDQVRFLVGWFRDTLKTAPIERLAVLRLDGDMYESTIEALTCLYPKLSCGGYAIIDDYALPGCRAAVDDYRTEHQIKEPLVRIDRHAKFWQRLS